MPKVTLKTHRYSITGADCLSRVIMFRVFLPGAAATAQGPRTTQRARAYNVNYNIDGLNIQNQHLDRIRADIPYVFTAIWHAAPVNPGVSAPTGMQPD